MSRAYRQTPAEIQRALDNALHPDAELKQAGVPADAAAVGQKFAEQQEQIDDCLPREELPVAVDDALAQAKASGEFDYVLTEEDKQEIAQKAAEKVDVPEGGGAYVLEDGETLDDVPEGFGIVYDPDREGEGVESGGSGGSGEWQYFEFTAQQEVGFFSITTGWTAWSEMWFKLSAVSPSETPLTADKKVYFGEGMKYSKFVVPGTLDGALPTSGSRSSYVYMNIQGCDTVSGSPYLGANGFTVVLKPNGVRTAGYFSAYMAKTNDITFQTDSDARFGVGTKVQIWGR